MTGRTNIIGTPGDGCADKWPIYGDSRPFRFDFMVMDHTGYLIPRVGGTYSFTLWTRDALYLWIGEKAKSRYTNNNSDAVAYPHITPTFKYDARRNVPIPIRVLFASGQGCSRFHLTIKDPNNKIIIDEKTAVTDDIIQGECDFPNFPKPSLIRPEPPTPKRKCVQGLDWAFYGLRSGSGPGRIPFVSDSDNPISMEEWPRKKFDTRVPLLNETTMLEGTTVSTVLNRGCSSSASAPIWGKNPNFKSSWNVVQLVGYFYPSETGIYTFTMQAITAVYIWIGESARWNFSNENANAYGYFKVSKTYLYEVKEVNKYIPFRVYAVSAANCFEFYVDIKDPKGQLIIGRNKPLTTDQFVTCDENEENNAPPINF